MKTEQPIFISSFTADATIYKNRFVSMSENGNAIHADEGLLLGVANADAEEGEQVPVIMLGIAAVISGKAFDLANPLSSFPDGRADTCAEPSNPQSLSSCSGADEFVRVLIK